MSIEMLSGKYYSGDGSTKEARDMETRYLMNAFKKAVRTKAVQTEFEEGTNEEETLCHNLRILEDEIVRRIIINDGNDE